MPQVATSPTLSFTNHWIGIYEQPGRKLTPSRRAVRDLQTAPVAETSLPASSIPNDPSTLVPVYRAALAERVQQFGPGSPQAARSAADLGLFLMQIANPAGAEDPLRRALAIDQANGSPAIDGDRENLANALEAAGKAEEAIALLRAAAAGHDAGVAARASAGLAHLDPENAVVHFTNAVAAEEAASGKENRKVAVLLHELALALREKGDDPSAEPLLRRALAIQQKIPKPDSRLTTGILNTLGNLLEGARRFDEAERLERAALKMSEEKFGPESAELSMTCTNLADVLWNKKDLAGAGQLYRRALMADLALYGAERPETAADIANLGMVTKEAGQAAAAEALLRRALAIYEKTLGPDSPQAKFVRDGLASRP
jgi:tetratricopeptide (TPR) repeat protein